MDKSTPELFWVRGRLSRLQLTTRGGFLIGLLVGGAVSGAAIAALQSRLHSIQMAQAEEAQVRYARVHGEAMQLAQDQTRGLCNVLLGWLLQSQQEALRLQQLEAAFPDFKTDAYRRPQLALRTEVEQRRRQAESLHRVMESTAKNASLCALASSNNSTPLWSNGVLTLYPQGWRLTSP